MSFIKSLLIAVLTIPFLTSCFTKELWQDIESCNKEYHENFKNFTITENIQGITFLGENYNYVFEDKEGVIKKLFSWKNISNLELIMFENKLDYEFNNDLKSHYINIALQNKHKNQANNPIDLNYPDRKFLAELDFISNDNVFTKKIIVSGKRYSSKPNIKYDNLYSLNKDYKVLIMANYKSKPHNTAKKITLTPIFLIGDTIIATTTAIAFASLIITVPTMIIFCEAMNIKSCFSAQ